jgi:hypothetical protein
MYKSEDDLVYFDPIVKADMEQGELLAVVYAPNSVDSQDEYADAETIRDMAHNFSKSGLGIDIKHNNTALPKEQAHVAESFIIQKGDPRFAEMKDYSGNPVDVTGGWGVVIKIDDPDLRKQYREGKWLGVSMGGLAIREAVKSGQEGDLDMTAEELKKALAESATATATATATAVTAGLTDLLKTAKLIPDPAAPADKKPENAAPVFKGDMSDPVARRKHLRDLKVHALTKDNDPSTPEGFEAIEKGMEEIDAEFADLKPVNSPLTPAEKSAGCEDTDTPDVRALKTKLFKAQGRSNQTNTGDAPAPTGNFMDSTDKDEQEAIALMSKMAQDDYGTPAKV